MNMQSAFLQAKLQAAGSLAKAASATGARAGLQGLRTQTSTFVKSPNTSNVPAKKVVATAIAEAPSPASPIRPTGR